MIKALPLDCLDDDGSDNEMKAVVNVAVASILV